GEIYLTEFNSPELNDFRLDEVYFIAPQPMSFALASFYLNTALCLSFLFLLLPRKFFKNSQSVIVRLYIRKR
ncbi:MAG: hypothetical protein AABY79_13695, partial [Nitrospirota bacterium]